MRRKVAVRDLASDDPPIEAYLLGFIGDAEGHCAMVEFGEERKLMAIRLGAQFAICFTDDPTE